MVLAGHHRDEGETAGGSGPSWHTLVSNIDMT